MNQYHAIVVDEKKSSVFKAHHGVPNLIERLLKLALAAPKSIDMRTINSPIQFNKTEILTDLSLYRPA